MTTIADVLRDAYRRARWLPWQPAPTNPSPADQLEHDAWIGELADLHREHGLEDDVQHAPGLAHRFLAADEAERRRYSPSIRFYYNPNIAPVVLGAKAAGVKVDPKVYKEALRRIEARLARDRIYDPVVPQAWAVKSVTTLRQLAKKGRSPAPTAPAATKAADKERQRLEKALQQAQAKSDRAMEARRRLDSGASRAKVTTANARWSRAAEARDRAQAALDAHRSGVPSSRPSTTPGVLGAGGIGNPPASPTLAPPAPSWPDTFPGAAPQTTARTIKPGKVPADALQLAEKRVEAVTTLGVDRLRLLDVLPVLKATPADERPLVAFVLANQRPELLGELDETMREDFGAPDNWLAKARPKRATAAGKARAKRAAKVAKVKAKKRETLLKRAKGEAVCALRVKERAARSDLARAERQGISLARQHGAALAKLQAAQRSCKHGCKRSARALCMAKPRVRELAQRLAVAMAAVASAHERHREAAKRLQGHGVTVAPLTAAAPVPRRRDGAPVRSSCGTVCRIQIRDGICGGQATILLPSPQGSPREVATRYCLIDASELITSHTPDNFLPDPRYPAATQERRYDRDQGEQLKVVNIAQNPRPELVLSTSASPLDGTPVATVDGLVLGGNGRTMGIKRNYAKGGTQFRDYLLKVSHEFGFTPAQVRKFDQPIVVRTIDPPPAEYPRLVRDLNQGLTQAMDVIAEGVSLARQMPAAALDVLAEALGAGDTELGEFFQSKASLPFIAALERGGIITGQNRSRLLRSDGLLTEDGRALAIRQIGASVLPDADLLELIGAELRQALARSAPFWLAAAAHGGLWDVRAPLERAVRDVLAARAAGLSLRRFFQQVDFFNPPQSHKQPMALRMLVLVDKLGGKPAVLARVARFFASEAQMYSGRQPTLLQPKDAARALDDAAKLANLDLPREVATLS